MKPEELRRLRKRLKWSQEQAAEYVQVHRITWNRWEQGQQPIPHSVTLLIRKLAAEK